MWIRDGTYRLLVSIRIGDSQQHRQLCYDSLYRSLQVIAAQTLHYLLQIALYTTSTYVFSSFGTDYIYYLITMTMGNTMNLVDQEGIYTLVAFSFPASWNFLWSIFI